MRVSAFGFWRFLSLNFGCDIAHPYLLAGHSISLNASIVGYIVYERFTLLDDISAFYRDTSPDLFCHLPCVVPLLNYFSVWSYELVSQYHHSISPSPGDPITFEEVMIDLPNFADW